MKTNDIIFWSDINGLPQVESIQLSQNFIPEWFRKTPSWLDGQNSKIENGTVKRCQCILDFCKVGYVIPLWCDLYVTVKSDGVWSWRSPDEIFQFDAHPSTQFTGHLSIEAKKNIALILKAYCPWRAKTPKGVSLLQLPMSYHFDPRFSLMPGIVETDRHYYINQQLLIHNIGETMIPRGTPLGMYVPIRREKYNLIVREETKEDRRNLDRAHYLMQSKFVGGYRTLKKFIDK